LGRIKNNRSFKYPTGVKNNMVKISINEGWSMNSKLAVIGLIGSIAVIIAVVLLN
jgi:hypothetical protein